MLHLVLGGLDGRDLGVDELQDQDQQRVRVSTESHGRWHRRTTPPAAAVA